MRDHRKLHAFQLADSLVLAVYGATRHFPREEMFGLSSQMRRSAVSVAANIVEGCARHSERDYIRFLDTSFASLRELGYFIQLAVQLKYLRPPGTQVLPRLQGRTAAALAGLLRTRRRSAKQVPVP